MSTVLVTGANRGIGLGFVRQLLSRPKVRYPLIIAATRTEPSGELRDLVDGHEGRLKNVLLGDLADEAAVLSAVDDIGNHAPAGVNILVNNACRTTQPTLRFPSIEAANELRQQLLTNAYGPALLTCSLFSKGLLTPPPGAPPNKPNYPIADLSSIHTIGTARKEEHAAPTTAPHYHRDGEVDVPIVVNIWSTQGSLRWTGEIWEGGSTRDDLVFHPIYAASKVALSGVTMHLAREMRNDAIVNCIHPGWVRTEHARRYAPLSTDQSASKVIDVIETWRTTKDSGQWLNEEGQKVPF